MQNSDLISAVVAVTWTAACLITGAPAWLLVAVPLLLAVRPRPVAQPRPEDLEALLVRRQLAVLRRVGGGADVLCASADGPATEEVRAALRISDFAVVRPRPGGVDVVVVVAGACDRRQAEARLVGTLGGLWSCTWLRFPDDGPTLDELRARIPYRGRAPRHSSIEGPS